jgi:hypothetical protein
MGFETGYTAADDFYNLLDERTIDYFDTVSVLGFISRMEERLKHFQQEILFNLTNLSNDREGEYFEALMKPINELSKYFWVKEKDLAIYYTKFSIDQTAILNHTAPGNELYCILRSTKEDLKEYYPKNSVEYDEAIDVLRRFFNFFAGYYLETISTFIQEAKRPDNKNRIVSSSALTGKVKNNTNEKTNMQLIAVVSFGFPGKYINALKSIYHQLRLNTGDFINRDFTKEEIFVQILTAKDFSMIDGEIHFGCETTQVAYILSKMEKWSNEFSYANIEASKRFFTKKGTLLTATNISKSKDKDPKQKAFIDSCFENLTKKQ